MQAGYSQGIHRQSRDLVFARRTGLALAMTARFIVALALASMIGPSLAHGSPACMTQSEARAKFPKATHLYMREHCWSDSAVVPVHSPRHSEHAAADAPVHSPRHSEHAAADAPSAPPTLADAPVHSARPEIINTGIDAGAQCQYS